MTSTITHTHIVTMNTSDTTMPYISATSNQQSRIPVTPRGSALYHVDWFLNGRPLSRHHDSKQVSIRDLARL